MSSCAGRNAGGRPARSSLSLAIALGVAVAAGSRAAHADVDLGGRITAAAGMALGRSYLNITPGSVDQGLAGGGGLVAEAGARIWVGPLLAAGTTAGMLGIFGPSETLTTAGLGVTFRAHVPVRFFALAEYGQHSLDGVGAGWMITPKSPSATTVPCWGAHVALDGELFAPSPLSLGLALFVLTDARQTELDVRVEKAFTGEANARYLVGGTTVGILLQAALGS